MEWEQNSVDDKSENQNAMSRPLHLMFLYDPTECSSTYASHWETEWAKVQAVVFEQWYLCCVGRLLSPKMAALMNSGKLSTI